MNKSIELIKKEVSPIVEDAKALAIASPEEMKSAVEMLSKLNKANDAITEEKEKITKPLNEALKTERARWKPMETLLGEAIDLVRGKIGAYQTKQLAIAAKKQEKIADKVAEGKLSVEAGVAKMDAIAVPAVAVATEEGAISFMTVQKFEVMDLKMLPEAYLLPNEVEIRKAMKAGVKLDGVKYWEEQVPKNSR